MHELSTFSRRTDGIWTKEGENTREKHLETAHSKATHMQDIDTHRQANGEMCRKREDGARMTTPTQKWRDETSQYLACIRDTPQSFGASSGYARKTAMKHQQKNEFQTTAAPREQQKLYQAAPNIQPSYASFPGYRLFACSFVCSPVKGMGQQRVDGAQAVRELHEKPAHTRASNMLLVLHRPEELGRYGDTRVEH